MSVQSRRLDAGAVTLQPHCLARKPIFSSRQSRPKLRTSRSNLTRPGRQVQCFMCSKAAIRTSCLLFARQNFEPARMRTWDIPQRRRVQFNVGSIPTHRYWAFARNTVTANRHKSAIIIFRYKGFNFLPLVLSRPTQGINFYNLYYKLIEHT